jgi:hypothetical protein
MLDFFLDVSKSSAASPTAAAASEAEATVAGRRGRVGADSIFLVADGGMTTILLGGTTGTEPVGGFITGETPVAGGADDVTGTEPVGGFITGETPVAGGISGPTGTALVGRLGTAGIVGAGDGITGTALVGGLGAAGIVGAGNDTGAGT